MWEPASSEFLNNPEATWLSEVTADEDLIFAATSSGSCLMDMARGGPWCCDCEVGDVPIGVWLPRPELLLERDLGVGPRASSSIANGRTPSKHFIMHSNRITASQIQFSSVPEANLCVNHGLSRTRCASLPTQPRPVGDWVRRACPVASRDIAQGVDITISAANLAAKTTTTTTLCRPECLAPCFVRSILPPPGPASLVSVATPFCPRASAIHRPSTTSPGNTPALVHFELRLDPAIAVSMTTTHIVEEPPHGKSHVPATPAGTHSWKARKRLCTCDVEANSSPDRQAHRRSPFSTWVKKLTNFKSSSDAERPKRNIKMRRGSKLNNPYPQSGHVSANHGNTTNGNGRINDGASSASFATAPTGSIVSADDAPRYSADRRAPPTAGAGSMADTVSTQNEGQRSMTAPSRGASSLAGTSRTVGGGMESRRGGNSTFSSPAPSVRSLTTTLTTIQSMAPHAHNVFAPSQANAQSIHFSQPFPSTSPASAIPAHLAPTGHPTTYTAATANNMLTDNASILTLASSSKRRRRRSMDTDASVRALAPSSLWGGSRESLPLSVLSANIESPGNSATPGMHGAGSRLGAERNSIYSTAGVAPTLASERNSLYAKQGDGASVRSGLLGQGRPDSVSGNNAMVMSPLASPREVRDEKTAAEDKEASRTAAQREY